MLCSDMYLISFVESDSSSTRITMVVISPQFYFGGESEFNSKCMETSEFASWIATVWGNGWSCNPKSSKSFLYGLLLFQAMGEVAFPRAVRDISFLMNLQGVKLQSNSSRRSSNLFMNCCCFEAMGLSYISKSIDYPTAIAMTSILHTKLKGELWNRNKLNPFCYLKWWGAFLQITKP